MYVQGRLILFSAGVDVIANDLNTGEMSTEKWKAETDIRKLPTNAFGKIDFVNESLGGRKPSKVIVYISVK